MGRPKNFNREDVLMKAIPLFWERGFADTGLQDLEQATGVNKSGLYSEFKNKEDLFLEALRHYYSHRGGREQLLSEPLGWDNIENYLKQRCLHLDKNRGCFAVNSMRELKSLPTEAQTIISEGRSSLKKLFAKNIAAAKPKLPTEALVEILSTFFSGLAIEQNLKNSPSANNRKIEEFINCLRRA